MNTTIDLPVTIINRQFASLILDRIVNVDLYYCGNLSVQPDYKLCLINDGQDLEKIDFSSLIVPIVNDAPVIFAGIHCGEKRMDEYGMALAPDYKGRGSLAAKYQQFILNELLPYVYAQFPDQNITTHAFAGFSLGGLSALDIVWNNPDVFSQAAVFSGSLWWRSRDAADKDFDPFTDRLMHRQIREGAYKPGLKFFFQCGLQDEKDDRNKNGVIDSVDDTIDAMKELILKGYKEGRDITYLQLNNGRHDLASWAKGFPVFLKQWIGS